jgi:hypothetical protein
MSRKTISGSTIVLVLTIALAIVVGISPAYSDPIRAEFNIGNLTSTTIVQPSYRVRDLILYSRLLSQPQRRATQTVQSNR